MVSFEMPLLQLLLVFTHVLWERGWKMLLRRRDGEVWSHTSSTWWSWSQDCTGLAKVWIRHTTTTSSYLGQGSVKRVRESCWFSAAVCFLCKPWLPEPVYGNDVLRPSNYLNAFTSLSYEPHITEIVILQKLWQDYKESCADVTWCFPA